MIIKSSDIEFNPDDCLEVKQDNELLVIEVTNVYDEHVEIYEDRLTTSIDLNRERALELYKSLQKYLGDIESNSSI